MLLSWFATTSISLWAIVNKVFGIYICWFVDFFNFSWPMKLSNVNWPQNVLILQYFISIYLFILSLLLYCLDSLVVDCSLQERVVQGSIPDRGCVIPKTLKNGTIGFPCLALNIKRETLGLSKFSKFSNSKNTIFESLMEDWLCQIDYVK